MSDFLAYIQQQPATCLNIREHAAIEFTKALLSNPAYYKKAMKQMNSLAFFIDETCKEGIFAADVLFEYLEKAKNDPDFFDKLES